MKYRIIQTCLMLFIFGIAFLRFPTAASAATITLSPNIGTFAANQPFDVAFMINEPTDSFNAVQAGVTLSPNLTINNVTLGNCNFAFVKTPSMQDLSFVGVILGGSKKNCIVYTITVVLSGTSDGTITFSNASVKRYGDAAELLTTVTNGDYAVDQPFGGIFSPTDTPTPVPTSIPTSIPPTSAPIINPTSITYPTNAPVSTIQPTQSNQSNQITDLLPTYEATQPTEVPQTFQTSQPGQTTQLVPATWASSTITSGPSLPDYNVNVKVQDANNKPLSDAQVTLQPNLQAGASTTPQTTTTNQDGVAEFKNVTPNMYTVRATKGNSVISEQLINTSGDSPTLTFGLQEKKTSQNLGALVVGMFGLATASYFLLRRFFKSLFHL